MSVVPPHAFALAVMLASATRTEPRVTSVHGVIRIEADLPDEMSPVIRSTILTALGTADRYGHVRAEDGDIIWAEIDNEPPPGDDDGGFLSGPGRAVPHLCRPHLHVRHVPLRRPVPDRRTARPGLAEGAEMRRAAADSRPGHPCHGHSCPGRTAIRGGSPPTRERGRHHAVSQMRQPDESERRRLVDVLELRQHPARICGDP